MRNFRRLPIVVSIVCGLAFVDCNPSGACTFEISGPNLLASATIEGTIEGDATAVTSIDLMLAELSQTNLQSYSTAALLAAPLSVYIYLSFLRGDLA